MTTEARKRATAKWQRNNTRQIILRLHKRTDADILERLDECGNKQGYIKQLIRADMENKHKERTCKRLPASTNQTVIVRDDYCEMEFSYWRCSECDTNNFEGAAYCMACGAKAIDN